MLHSVDASIDLINQYEGIPETPVAFTPKVSTGFGIIEAPRGTLFHKVDISAEGKVIDAKVIVPTGQNQIGIVRKGCAALRYAHDRGKRHQ